MALELIITLSIFVAGWLIQYFVFTAKNAERITLLEHTVVVTTGDHTKVLERLACIETKLEIYWNMIDEKMLHLLKSYPTNLEKDMLLDRQLHNTLTLSEAERLRTIISCEFELEKNRKQDEKTTGLGIAYILELGRLEQIIFELLTISNQELISRTLKKK